MGGLSLAGPLVLIWGFAMDGSTPPHKGNGKRSGLYMVGYASAIFGPTNEELQDHAVAIARLKEVLSGVEVGASNGGHSRSKVALQSHAEDSGIAFSSDAS